MFYLVEKVNIRFGIVVPSSVIISPAGSRYIDLNIKTHKCTYGSNFYNIFPITYINKELVRTMTDLTGHWLN